MALVRIETDREFRIFVDGEYKKPNPCINNPEEFTFEFEDNITIMLVYTYPTFKDAFIIFIDESKNEINLPCTAIRGEIYLHVKRRDVRKLERYISILKTVNNESLNVDRVFYRKLELIILNRKFKEYYVDWLFAEYKIRERNSLISHRDHSYNP